MHRGPPPASIVNGPIDRAVKFSVCRKLSTEIEAPAGLPVAIVPGGDSIRAQSPFGRVGEPHEVASAVHFLASEEGAWSSGAVLDCNGASYLH